MRDHFKERSTRDYRQKQLFTKTELEARESLCVHEQLPFCNAACPMKLEVREFVADMAKGDFAAARTRLERVAPFPLILAHGCEAPCREKCRLGEQGESVEIGALERACMTYGQSRAGRLTLKFKKKKSAVVFGADLFTLVLAGEIERKNYPLTFYVSEPNAESVLEHCAPFLSPADRAIEASRLSGMDMKIEYNSPLSAEFFAEKRVNYDIVCVCRSIAAVPDDTTLVTSDGAITCTDAACSGKVLPALFDARRAGISVDRLAQGLDAGNMRGEEGPVSSKLYTNMEGVKPSSAVPEHGVYTAEEATDEARRCIQCHCDECVDACVYLQHFKKFPRILTREIYNNVDIIMGDHMMNKAINSCSLCGQCSVVCPNGYDVADVCLKARENMVATDKLSLAVHEFALYDMLFSNGEAFLARPQPGFEKCRWVFFPGCQAGAIAPETVRRAYLDLSSRLDGGVTLMLGCCGVIARWAGRTELYEEQVTLLKSELAKLGDGTVITACPTCQKELADILGKPVEGIWDVLGKIGLPEQTKSEKRPAVMHDSCAARGNHEMQESVRTLAKNLGCELTETPWSGDLTTCCGYGGLVSYANREVAHKMADWCVSQSDAPFITYCMACRDRFAREGHESMHILELAYNSPAGAPPDISEKRRNRLSLKNQLLKDLWGEDVMKDKYDFTLDITDECRAMMDDRMILDTDVYDVMQRYKETGEAVQELDTGLLVTRARLGNVTFWVKFTEDQDGRLTVRRAYSHRMTIETR